jgi:hypothetical protein
VAHWVDHTLKCIPPEERVVKVEARSETECPICLDHMADEDACTLRCTHTFHLACLTQATKFGKTCPICRAAIPSVNLKDTMALFKAVPVQGLPGMTEIALGGCKEAQYALAYHYRQRGEFTQALRFYFKAAAQGCLNSHHAVGFIFNEMKDDVAAVVWYTKAAEQGLAISQQSIGSMYYYGRGVPQNYETAFGWYLKAARTLVEGQYMVGYMYLFGQGVPKSDPDALRYLLLAQEKPQAKFYIASLVDDADQWLTLAAEQGFVRATTALAYFYLHGKGVPKDTKQGVDLLLKASDLGCPDAMYALASICKCADRADALFRKAAGLGHKKALARISPLSPPSSSV